MRPLKGTTIDNLNHPGEEFDKQAKVDEQRIQCGSACMPYYHFNNWNVKWKIPETRNVASNNDTKY